MDAALAAVGSDAVAASGSFVSSEIWTTWESENRDVSFDPHIIHQ